MNSDRTVVLDAVRTFAYTSGTRNDPTVEEVARVLQLPYVLWAYDPTSGHALILGNRSETNINRPFEAGDQEFVEAALSIHLDVLRRKNDEAQLRQAKQRAEAATASRTALLTTLSQELRVSMQAVMALLEMFKTRSRSEEVWGEMDQHAAEIADSCSYLLALSEDAARVVGQDAMQPILNVGWVPLDNIVRSASRAEYAASVRRGVALTTLGCRRRTAVCVDTAQMQYALRRLTTVALRRTRSGGSVQITPSRRSDGAVEILIKSFSGPMGHVADTDALDSLHVQHLSPLDEYLLISRRIIEAHGGILTMEHVGEDDLQMRVILEAHLARDESLGVG
jgi:signal transduction histidine kinase